MGRSRRVACLQLALPVFCPACRGYSDVEGVFQELLEFGEEVCCDGTVQNAVVDGQGQSHGGAHAELAVADNGLGACGADGEDCGLRRVDDGGEVFDAVIAEVLMVKVPPLRLAGAAARATKPYLGRRERQQPTTPRCRPIRPPKGAFVGRARRSRTSNGSGLSLRH